MANNDIRARDEIGDGKARYWVKVGGGLIPGAAGSLRLAVIDEYGHVELTPAAQPWDDRARTKEEAIQHHLRGAIAEADRDLQQRRREAPEPEAKPEPISPATKRFMDDGPAAIDLSVPDYSTGGGVGWG